MQDTEQLMTRKQVAERLQITTHTLHRWITEGKVPELRLSDYVRRLRWSDVCAALGMPMEPPDSAGAKQEATSNE